MMRKAGFFMCARPDELAGVMNTTRLPGMLGAAIGMPKVSSLKGTNWYDPAASI
jgi:hypothetical protein